MIKPHTHNTAVKATWGQWWHEFVCSLVGHQNYVPRGGAYPGMPQSHCYRCGKKNSFADKQCSEWVDPIG